MYDAIKKCLALSLLFAGVMLVLALVRYVDTAERVTADLPQTADKTVAREFEATRKLVSAKYDSLERKLDKQITALRGDVFHRIDGIERDAFGQIDLIRKDANKQLDETRKAAIAEIAKISTPAGETITEAKALLPPAQNVLNVASDNADLLGDCDHNPNCLANRTIGTTKAVEKMAQSGQKMMDAVAKETPDTAAAVKSTSKDLSTIVARFAKPASWIKGVIGTAASTAGKFLGF